LPIESSEIAGTGTDSSTRWGGGAPGAGGATGAVAAGGGAGCGASGGCFFAHAPAHINSTTMNMVVGRRIDLPSFPASAIPRRRPV
jgi:hypothetical protein